MAIPFTCPKCGQKLTLTASRPGDWLDCPACEKAVQIPGGDPRPAPAARVAGGETADFLAAMREADEQRARNTRRALMLGLLAVLMLGLGIAVIALPNQRPAESAAAVPPPPLMPPGSPIVIPPPPPIKKQEPPKPPEPARPELADVELTQTKLRTLKLGVSSKGFDDVGAILRSLGRGYAYDELTPTDFEDLDKLKQYDVLFLNCGGEIGPENLTVTALREFVSSGRALYASDRQFDRMAKTFPDAVDPKLRLEGKGGTFDADVLDRGLQELLGKTVSLEFDLDGWQAAAFGGQHVTTILRAAENDRLKKGTPLLVKFPHGQGTVFFTSFHNSVIATDTAKKLLRYLVFSAVVADAESRVLRIMKRGDFTLTEPELLTITGPEWKVIRAHEMKREGLFRVGVGFNNEGAEVKLVIAGPGGIKFEKTARDAFIVEVRNASVGDWTFTLTSDKSPYPNFPLTLVVGELKEK